MLLVIDNYDSFTYNLVQYFWELGETVEVWRNDQITVEQIRSKTPAQIVISPGPCTPDDAGISLEVVEKLGPHIPLLGVCLGHQSIGQVYGGKVVRAGRVMHGKVSPIYHDGSELFTGLPRPFEATRYHSLLVERESFPAELTVTAETQEQEIMALRHKKYPIWGVQFHPESILTVHGKALLQNFLVASRAPVVPAKEAGPTTTSA